MSPNCVACNNTLLKEESITCSVCNNDYHYLCAGLSIDKFKNMRSVNKSTWKCCKTKKTSDGTAPVNLLDDIKNELSAQFQESHEKVMQKLNELCKTTANVEKDHAELMKTINFLNAKYTDLSNKVTELESLKPKVLKLQTENKDMLLKIESLEYKLDQKDQEINSTKMEIRGVGDLRNHNLTLVVRQIASRIGIDLSETDIACTSLEQPRPRPTTAPQTSSRNDANVHPAILVSFRTTALRNAYLDAARKHNKTRTNMADKLNTGDIGMSSKNPIYLQEALTPRLRYLFLQARRIAKQKSYKYFWLKDGVIRAKRDDGGITIYIKYVSSLDKL